MKILFFAPANSAHIRKWCGWFKKRGHDVSVLTFHDGRIDEVKTYYINTGTNSEESDMEKLKYLKHGREIREIVKDIDPDVINVHYATSYGTAAAMAGLKNYVLSVWGSDIYDFPKKSVFHKALLEYSLNKASHLFSTSSAMAEEARKYTDKEIIITPFGVDTELFSPSKRNRLDDDFVIGTVKTLSPNYGIDKILRAAEMIHRERPEIPLKVRIAGKGPSREQLEKLAYDLGIGDIVTWVGFISQKQAAVEWANMDCAVIPSELESFGVSAVEAEASGIPVIISDVSGLMESTLPGVTSIVTERGNADQLKSAIVDLYENKEKRKQMGLEGRKLAVEKYSLDECFQIPERYFSLWSGK